MPLNIRLVTSLANTPHPGVISGTTTERIYPHDILSLAGREYRICALQKQDNLAHFLAIWPKSTIFTVKHHKPI